MYAQVMKVVGILVVATLLVAVLRIHPQPLPPSPPHTASGGYKAILVRQGSSNWQMLNRVPESWYAYAYTGSNFWLQNFPDPDATKWETGPTPVAQVPVTTSVVIGVYKGGSLCEEMDCGLFPPGTVTQTISLSGRPGIVYRQPYKRRDGLYDQYGRVDVRSTTADESGSWMEFAIAGAPSQHELDQWYSEVISVLENIYFVPYYINFQWDDYLSESSNIPGVLRYHIRHPQGTTVNEVGSRIKVEGNVPGIGPITVIFEPNRPRAEWENAEPIFGNQNLGQISSSIQGNMRTTQYSLRYGPEPPIKITATTPVFPFGSDQYWKSEQTVFTIFDLSDLDYEMAYP